jgi:hypothetical protein
MLVTDKTYAGIESGAITVLLRKWKAQRAEPGDRIDARDLVLVVDEVRQVRASSITDVDARAAGFDDASDALGSLEERGLGKDDPDRLIWRVDFHVERGG